MQAGGEKSSLLRSRQWLEGKQARLAQRKCETSHGHDWPADERQLKPKFKLHSMDRAHPRHLAGRLTGDQPFKEMDHEEVSHCCRSSRTRRRACSGGRSELWRS